MVYKSLFELLVNTFLQFSFKSLYHNFNFYSIFYNEFWLKAVVALINLISCSSYFDRQSRLILSFRVNTHIWISGTFRWRYIQVDCNNNKQQHVSPSDSITTILLLSSSRKIRFGTLMNIGKIHSNFYPITSHWDVSGKG